MNQLDEIRTRHAEKEAWYQREGITLRPVEHRDRERLLGIVEGLQAQVDRLKSDLQAIKGEKK